MPNIIVTVRDDKKLHVSGKDLIPAFREESVAVQLLNFSPSVVGNLVMTVYYNGVKVAECSAFTTTDSVTTGTLNMNTEELADIMDIYHKRAQRKFQMTLWDDTLKKLLVNDNINVMSNPYDPSLTGPTPIT